MIFFVFLIAVIIASYIFLRRPFFGALAKGGHLQRLQRSPNYKKGQFQNLHNTPALSEGANMFAVLWEFLFIRHANKVPPFQLPAQHHNLRELPSSQNSITWFGHSSYYLQVEGKRILVDPVFSGHASPVAFTTRSFPGTNGYQAQDIPDLDYLLITHDHWDHLDFATVTALQPRVKRVICGLGVGAHFERWGFTQTQITELDWNDTLSLEDGFRLTALPARHFSGRSLKRNTSLWVSYALTTPKRRLYLGGDSGYDDHFKSIGEQHGPFDLAILECGQFDANWKYIHMAPPEVVDAALDLTAARLMPVHWGKFTLANHAWNEPIRQVSVLAAEKNLPLLTPALGEVVNLDELPEFPAWWEESNSVQA